MYAPHTCWSASTISPSVACALRALDQHGHQVRLGRGRGAQLGQPALHLGAVAARADGLHAADLLALHLGVDAMDRRLAVVALGVAVDADDDLIVIVDLLLQLERRVGDLALRVVALDRLDHAAELVDLGEVGVGLLLHLVGQRLDEVGAAERVDGVGHAGLVGDDLLRAQRDPDGVLGRQRERLVVGVGVQRLRAAEHAGERLDRRADDVVERLLGGERHAGGLRVEAHQPRARVLRAVGLAAARAPRSGARRGTWRSPRRSRSGR